MKKHSYIIVDDDMAFIMLLKKHLEKFENLEFVASYTSTIEAAKGITKLKPNILFLDMQIDSLDGLDMLSIIDPLPKTIVISNSTDQMNEALSLNVFDYIKKPIESHDRLAIAINKVTNAD
ncbi:MAG: response regulator [Cyclobacteriaceae bacterium]